MNGTVYQTGNVCLKVIEGGISKEEVRTVRAAEIVLLLVKLFFTAIWAVCLFMGGIAGLAAVAAGIIFMIIYAFCPSGE